MYKRLFHDKIAFYSNFIGINIFNQTFRKSLMAYFSCALCVVYLVSSVYTIVTDTTDFSFKLKCLSLIGIPFQVNPA